MEGQITICRLSQPLFDLIFAVKQLSFIAVHPLPTLISFLADAVSWSKHLGAAPLVAAQNVLKKT